MNSFSNMEINDLLDNRFRLEDKHTPNYLAECFQRLFPTLGRMGLSTVIDEIARANHRAFNSSRLPIRGETLDLNFFFELWKKNFKFEGSYSDKFVFSDELKLAFRVNPREFWEVLVRADRDMGNYLKDSIELLKYRDLPREISFTLKAGRGSLDCQEAAKIKELLPRTNGSLGKIEDIAKACISIWGMPKFFDERRLVEELCRENNIRRIDREPYTPFPLKNIANLRVDFLKRATEDRFRENRKMEGLSLREFEIQKNEAPANSLPSLAQRELLVRGDYRGHGDPVEPAYPQTPILKVKAGAADFSALQDEFERALGNDFILFRQQYPQYNQSIVLSETFRTAEMQARELLRAWKNGKLVSTYGKGKIKENLFSFMLKIKNIEVEEAKLHTIETIQKELKLNSKLAELIKTFIDNPTEAVALELFTKISADGMNGAPIYGVTLTSKHLSGLAVDVSGSQNAQLLKQDLILFLHKTQKYRILIYPHDGSGPTLISLKGNLYEKKEIKSLDYLLSFISTHSSTWFFHVEKGYQ